MHIKKLNEELQRILYKKHEDNNESKPQKNEALTNKEIADVFIANGFKIHDIYANYVDGTKGNTSVWVYMSEKKISTSDKPYTKGNYPKGFSKDVMYAQINAKLPNTKKELDTLLKSIKIESAQKNEDREGMKALNKILKSHKFAVNCGNVGQFFKTKQEAEDYIKLIKAGKARDMFGNIIKPTESVEIVSLEESVQKNESLDVQALKEYLAKENSRALNIAYNDDFTESNRSYYKGKATAIYEIQTKFNL